MKIDRVTCSRRCTLSIELLTNWATNIRNQRYSREREAVNEACQLRDNYGKTLNDQAIISKAKTEIGI